MKPILSCWEDRVLSEPSTPVKEKLPSSRGRAEREYTDDPSKRRHLPSPLPASQGLTPAEPQSNKQGHMTREEAINELRELQDVSDIEGNHIAADMVLEELLRSLGYEDVADEFEKVEKWYA